ncbi:hypothetical protein EDC01DRAFT_731678 [Geopyxis carbonaria]|nr:hypothetical protein EDC01DRAFT_731678 [Geopyxis carbonaria]
MAFVQLIVLYVLHLVSAYPTVPDQGLYSRDRLYLNDSALTLVLRSLNNNNVHPVRRARYTNDCPPFDPWPRRFRLSSGPISLYASNAGAVTVTQATRWLSYTVGAGTEFVYLVHDIWRSRPPTSPRGRTRRGLHRSCAGLLLLARQCRAYGDYDVAPEWPVVRYPISLRDDYMSAVPTTPTSPLSAISVSTSNFLPALEI